MEDTAKYLIHATIAANGVVERSDVVGAVFGQTEGLLGDELDLRDLQQSSKVGRIDVSIESENGQSFGEITVASSLDKAETAILAAALETITRVGPCQAGVEVTSIEDVRAAKRRKVVDRAKELLASGFNETSLSSREILEEVRESTRVEGIADYEGLPAGPRVADSDAIIVVEGRADVLTLLECGIKNAIAVEGTNVPAAVADLTNERTVTAFLDGDRGGELILRELAQVGAVDYVAFAPAGKSVEDLDRSEVFEALRGKVPHESLSDEPDIRQAVDDDVEPELTAESDDADSSTGSAEPPDRSANGDRSDDPTETDGDRSDERESTEANAGGETNVDGESKTNVDGESGADDEHGGETETAAGTGAAAETEREPAEETEQEPKSLRDHVREVVDRETGTARLLDEDGDVFETVDARDVFDAVADAESAPYVVILDGEIDQRLLDVAAQRGVSELFGRSTGEFVKQPIGTRVRTATQLLAEV